MKEMLQERLKELRAEFEAGQGLLNELEGKMAATRETLLRISGAIQVIEEILARSESEAEVGMGRTTHAAEQVVGE